MAVTRSFTNAYECTDYTQELLLVPNSWTLLGDVGLFQPEALATTTATFEVTQQTLGLLKDYKRGTKPQTSKDDVSKMIAYNIPSFPIQEELLAHELIGKRMVGSADQLDTKANALAKKIARIRKNIDATKEVARFKTLTTGLAYAPNGTVVANYFSDMGVTQTSVDFVLNSGTTDVMAKVEEVIASIQDNAQTGDVITEIVGYCSPEFFAAFIAHAKVSQAYLYYSSTANQEILRNRAGGKGLYREFQFGGLRLIEVRTVLAGERLIPAKEAVFVPVGTSDSFVSYMAPAARFDYVNTLAEEAYLWTFESPKGTHIDIEGEFSVLNVLRRPKLVVKGTTP